MLCESDCIINAYFHNYISPKVTSNTTDKFVVVLLVFKDFFHTWEIWDVWRNKIKANTTWKLVMEWTKERRQPLYNSITVISTTECFYTEYIIWNLMEKKKYKGLWLSGGKNDKNNFSLLHVCPPLDIRKFIFNNSKETPREHIRHYRVLY